MENQRFLASWAVVALFSVALFSVGIAGCDSTSTDKSGSKAGSAVTAVRDENHLKVAKHKLALGELDAASDSVSKSLVQDPNNSEAKLVASQIESGRGNHEMAVELASSIDRLSKFSADAVEVKANSLVKLNRHSQAADVLIEALETMPGMTQWRHRAWELLNRVGRRDEASRQVDALCFVGEATQRELLSIIRRSWSFPFSAEGDEDPTQGLQPGLGMARWYYTQNDFNKALQELDPQYEGSFESPAACALYGRLLMETQASDEFRRWHTKCDAQVQQVNDYWAALGVYFYDERQYEASARALLEAVYRDPTDRVSFQRLSKVFGSLERLDEGAQFRNRGVMISETEKFVKVLLRTPAERAAKLGLVRDLAQLGRPFETVLWSKLLLTAANQQERAQLDTQFQMLRQDPRAVEMASGVSMAGVEMSEYSVEPAMESLRSAVAISTDSIKPTQVELLATPRLENVASEVGIDFQWYPDVEINLAAIPIHESLGGGVGAVDYDLDGWVDVYLGQGSGDPPTDQCTRSDALFRNQNGTFHEVTLAADVQDFHYTSGVAAGDVNQDGFADLWIGALGHNRLFLNNGDGTFRDITERLVCDDQFTSSLAIADINGDTLPDLFEANYIDMDGAFALPEIGEDGKPKLPGPLSHLSAFDRWFENLGDGQFRLHVISLEVSEPGTSLGVVVTDFDSNGVNEVFIGNDVRPNHFLFHRGNNQMTNLADVKGVANGFQGVPNGCMGISAADFNRDGLIDIHITNYYKEANNLYIQDASGLYTDYAIRYGISEPTIPMVGFGTKSIDFDRNGWLDLVITNGHIFDTRIHGKEKFFQMPPLMMMSKGGQFAVTEVDDDSGYWDQMYLGRSMASLDFNRDGAMDILIGHSDKPVALLRNQTSTPGNWIQLELVGTRCERDAVGARVTVRAGQESFTHWVTAGDGYLCSDEPVLDFGLGVSQSPVKVEVDWPGGHSQAFEQLVPGQRYLLVEGETDAVQRVR
jgi:tetratricopeptide (TPR) repeat protein